jgi:DNA-binding transcriptional ArsR family regulator
MVALKNGNPQYPPAQARADRKMKRIERLRFIPQALRADPELQEMPTTALVERLREQTGAGESTIYGDLSELKERGIIEQNGKVKVLG